MTMSVAKTTNIVSEPTKAATHGLDEAIKLRIAGGNKTLRNPVWWIKEARVRKSSLTEYQVNMMIGFIRYQRGAGWVRRLYSSRRMYYAHGATRAKARLDDQRRRPPRKGHQFSSPTVQVFPDRR